jgi:hypothetical protein
MTDDKDEGLRYLFRGLCSLFGIDAEASEDPDDGYDFIVRYRPRVYVVILPEPEDRQVEIASLLFHGNKVLILDRHDLDLLRRCPDRFSAAYAIEGWLRDGTHASAERQRMGITS